ncbi:ergothioneine biosynthesis glutamate--cysteine ligase EgtA [Frankia sp. AiPa1]|nr:ergothioneine biosynthesis glutamate--cysteine ligase EgtA [Frankia sp. AiPa1]
MDRHDVHRPVTPARSSRALACLADGASPAAWATAIRPAGDPPLGAAAHAVVDGPADTDASGMMLPGGSRITFEPGGQLELSGPPATLAAAIAATAADLRLVRAALAEHDLALVGMGTDPLRTAGRQTTASRYAAMEKHFLAGGGASGTSMMFSTASVQVNLDLGATPAEADERFRLAHTVGPVLTAMFAASPALAGRRTRWRSTRQAIWSGIDASRTRSVLDVRLGPDAGPTATLIPGTPDTPGTPAVGSGWKNGGTGRELGVGAGIGAGPLPCAELAARWARYLLDARLMMIAAPEHAGTDDSGEHDDHFIAATAGHTFADWLAGRGPVARPPTIDDLRYHATTLFPPVRPRGWWELRYLDAQPGDGWMVAVAVTTALLTDPVAAAGAGIACEQVAGRWSSASTLAMADESLHQAGLACLDLATAALRRAGAPGDLVHAVEEFTERYPGRGRCPADELSERFTRIGPAGLLREEARSCISVA